MPGYHTPEINVSWRKISSLTSLSPSTTSVFVMWTCFCCCVSAILLALGYFVHVNISSLFVRDQLSFFGTSTFNIYSFFGGHCFASFFLRLWEFFVFLLLYCRVFFFVHIGFCCWPFYWFILAIYLIHNTVINTDFVISHHFYIETVVLTTRHQ